MPVLDARSLFDAGATTSYATNVSAAAFVPQAREGVESIDSLGFIAPLVGMGPVQKALADTGRWRDIPWVLGCTQLGALARVEACLKVAFNKRWGEELFGGSAYEDLLNARAKAVERSDGLGGIAQMDFDRTVEIADIALDSSGAVVGHTTGRLSHLGLGAVVQGQLGWTPLATHQKYFVDQAAHCSPLGVRRQLEHCLWRAVWCAACAGLNQLVTGYATGMSPLFAPFNALAFGLSQLAVELFHHFELCPERRPVHKPSRDVTAGDKGRVDLGHRSRDVVLRVYSQYSLEHGVRRARFALFPRDEVLVNAGAEVGSERAVPGVDATFQPVRLQNSILLATLGILGFGAHLFAYIVVANHLLLRSHIAILWVGLQVAFLVVGSIARAFRLRWKPALAGGWVRTGDRWFTDVIDDQDPLLLRVVRDNAPTRVVTEVTDSWLDLSTEVCLRVQTCWLPNVSCGIDYVSIPVRALAASTALPIRPAATHGTPYLVFSSSYYARNGRRLGLAASSDDAPKPWDEKFFIQVNYATFECTGRLVLVAEGQEGGAGLRTRVIEGKGSSPTAVGVIGTARPVDGSTVQVTMGALVLSLAPPTQLADGGLDGHSRRRVFGRSVRQVLCQLDTRSLIYEFTESDASAVPLDNLVPLQVAWLHGPEARWPLDLDQEAADRAVLGVGRLTRLEVVRERSTEERLPLGEEDGEGLPVRMPDQDVLEAEMEYARKQREMVVTGVRNMVELELDINSMVLRDMSEERVVMSPDERAQRTELQARRQRATNTTVFQRLQQMAEGEELLEGINALGRRERARAATL